MAPGSIQALAEMSTMGYLVEGGGVKLVGANYLGLLGPSDPVEE